MGAGFNGLNVEVGITLERLTKQLARAEARMVKTANKMERGFATANTRAARSFRRVDQAVATTSRNMLGLRNILLTAFSVRQIQRFADAWTVAENKISAASEVAGRAGRDMSGINEIASRTRSGIAETADLYAKLLRATKDVAESELDVARATELTNKAFKAGGAAASEQAAGILQLAQGLSSGVLQGDELRSIRENAPLVAQAIADEFNVSIGKLKELGAEGALTSERVFNAILNAAPMIEAAFATTNATVGEGFTLVKNAITEYIAGADDAVGASEKIGAALVLLSENIDKLVAAGGILAGVFIGPVLLRALKSAVPIIRSAGAAFGLMTTGATAGAGALALMRGAMGLLGGPLGVVIAGLSILPLLTTSTTERIADMEKVSSDAATALDAYAKASRDAAADQDHLAGKVSAATAEILSQSRAELQNALSALKDEYEDVFNDMGGVGLFDKSELAGAVDIIDQARQRASSIGYENNFLTDLAEGIKGLADGSATIGDLTSKMSALAGAGEEVTRAISQFDLARMDPANIDIESSRAKLVSLAETIGLFETELAAIDTAAGAEEAAAAYTILRDRMFDAADAGELMRGEQLAALRQMLIAAGATEQEIVRIEAALSANNAELQELVDRAQDGETAARELGQAADGVNFDGAILSAEQLVDVLRRAMQAAHDVSSAAQDSLERARIDFDLHDQPLARAAAHAGLDFDSRSPQLPAGTFPSIVEDRETERRATIAAAVATEEYRQALADLGSGGGGGGGGDSDPAALTGIFTASEEEIARLEQQIETIGKTSGEIARMTAETQLLNEAKARGLDLDAVQVETGKTLREEIAGQAAEIGRLTQQYEQLNARTQFFNGMQDQLLDGLLDAAIAGKDLTGTFADLAKQIAKAALQAALLGKGPFAGLFGGSAGTGLLTNLFAEGGYTGAGGKHEPKGVVHGGEYVFSKAAVQKIGVPRLEALHKQMKGYSGGGFVGAGSSAVAQPASNKIINLLDPRLLGDYLATSEGESQLVNVIRSNRDQIFG